jgi:hypothetical protein
MKFLRKHSLAVSIFTISSIFLSAVPSAKAAPTDVASLWASIDTSAVVNTPQNEAIAVSALQEINASADPTAVLAGLTDAQLADLKVYLTPKEAVFVPPVASVVAPLNLTRSIAAATVCRQASGSFTEVNGFGATLWTFKTTGGWCYNGTSVTSASYVGSYATVDFVGWFYSGIVDHTSGVIGGSGRSYSQGKFQLIFAGVVVQQVLPCNRIAGFANGSVVSDHTCGLS